MGQNLGDEESVRSRTPDGRTLTFHGISGPVAQEDQVESVAQPRMPAPEDDPNLVDGRKIPFIAG